MYRVVFSSIMFVCVFLQNPQAWGKKVQLRLGPSCKTSCKVRCKNETKQSCRHTKVLRYRCSYLFGAKRCFPRLERVSRCHPLTRRVCHRVCVKTCKVPRNKCLSKKIQVRKCKQIQRFRRVCKLFGKRIRKCQRESVGFRKKCRKKKVLQRSCDYKKVMERNCITKRIGKRMVCRKTYKYYFRCGKQIIPRSMCISTRKHPKICKTLLLHKSKCKIFRRLVKSSDCRPVYRMRRTCITEPSKKFTCEYKNKIVNDCKLIAKYQRVCRWHTIHKRICSKKPYIHSRCAYVPRKVKTCKIIWSTTSSTTKSPIASTQPRASKPMPNPWAYRSVKRQQEDEELIP